MRSQSPIVRGSLAVLMVLGVASAKAQTAPAPAAAPPAAMAPGIQGDPVVAKVNGIEIHMSDLSEAAQSLPEDMRGMPPTMLYPMLLDQLADRAALVVLAEKRGLPNDPVVKRQMQRASDQALQGALIRQVVTPQITPELIRARYDRDIAGKPGEAEVHARHILVANEADAKAVIEQLNKGGDFAAIAKEKSSDPGGAQGGDLGFFKKGDMVPEFANAAFAMKPGEISKTPVKSQFGWHVIQVLEVRQSPPATFEQSQEELRQKMIQEGVDGLLKQARADVTVQKFNPDGTPQKAIDTAVPPPAPAAKP